MRQVGKWEVNIIKIILHPYFIKQVFKRGTEHVRIRRASMSAGTGPALFVIQLYCHYELSMWVPDNENYVV